MYPRIRELNWPFKQRIPMENKGSSNHQPPPSSSSLSSTLDNNNNRSSKSLRLQTTLAELEWKVEKILEVVEDNGDTFAQRAQMYYQKRPELIEMLGDLRKSYRALADKVVTIWSGNSIPASNYFCCCSSTCNNHHSGHLMIFDHQPRLNDDPTTSECHDYDDDDPHHRRRRELIFTEQQNNNNNNNYPDDVIIRNTAAAEEKVISSVDVNPCDGEKGGGGGGEEMVVVADGGGSWDELLAQVTELMEENTSKQAELIRRYAKKNEDMKLLVKENRRLRELLSHTKINDANKQTSSHTRWKPRLFFRKLLP